MAWNEKKCRSVKCRKSEIRDPPVSIHYSQRKFVGSHTCPRCHDLLADQEHIASCAGLRAHLSHCEFIDFNLLTYSNRSIIEHALLLVSQELIFDQHALQKF
jgi:hypothetical protein